jgi:hypothetical protein
MAVKSARHLPRLRSLGGQVQKHATPGERVIGSLFTYRGGGWSGDWTRNRTEQALHLRNWTYVAVHTICSKLAGILPNLAFVVDREVAAQNPGTTVKACERGLRNGVDGSWNDRSVIKAYGANATLPPLGSYGRHLGFGGTELISEGPHSWLTMGAYRSKALSVVKPHEELEPLPANHRLRRLVENPNPVDSYFDITYEEQMFDEMMGCSYEWLVPNPWGVPCERWCIPSHWVWPRTGGAGGRLDTARWQPPESVGREGTLSQRYRHPYTSLDDPHADELISYYEVRPWGGLGMAGVLYLPPDEVLYNRWKHPTNKIDGYSKLAAVAQWIDSEESISASRWAQFGNTARPEFWVELGVGYEDVDDPRIDRLEKKIAAKIQGEYNYGKPLITPPGAKVTPLSFSPAEMTYFQSEEQIRDMILAAFQVPKSAVGISNDMTYGSLLASMAQLCSMCLNPRLAQRGATQTKHLARRWDGDGRKCRIWYDDCVPADPNQVNQDLAEDRAQYAVTPNEVRALRGRKPYRHGGDNPIVTGPAGPMPLALNKQEDVEGLADVIQQLQEAASAGQEGQGGAEPEGSQEGGEPGVFGQPPGLPGEGANDVPLLEDRRGGQGQDPGASPEAPEQDVDENGNPLPAPTGPGSRTSLEDLARRAAGVKHPNGPPHKQYRKARGAPCNPGETSAQTGCKPASGDGGAAGGGAEDSPTARVKPGHGGTFRVYDLHTGKPISPPFGNRAGAENWATQAGHVLEGPPQAEPLAPAAKPSTPIKPAAKPKPSGKNPPAPAPRPAAPEPLSFSHAEEARKFTDRVYADWAGKLDAEEAGALTDYSGSAYTAVNKGLREVDVPDDLQNLVRSIDSAVRKAPPLPAPVRAYRGIGKGSGQLSQLREGDVLTDQAFMSVSMDYNVAHGFSGDALLEITLPAGTRAASVDSLYGEGEAENPESELVLPRGSGLRVVQRRFDSYRRRYVISAEYVPT